MLEFQKHIEESGIVRSADNNIFFANGEDVTNADLDQLRANFLATHPDWTLEEIEALNIAGLVPLGDGPDR